MYPPQSHLVLDIKHHWMAFMFGMFTPVVMLNGHHVPGVRWGRIPIPLQPGQYHLHVHVPYLVPSQIGPADQTVWIQPGQALEVEYRAPLWAFSRGALGPAPQPWPGLVAQFIILGVLVAFLLLVFLGIVVAAVAG
ncbi:hypothetical protein ACIBG8_41870 [Nonomuraea sp. NPDC050556]|uniref:hypothetical protein n=1 Tax=Nonomuraea sp. NPDC050556 TaxID=3364369 RepID=UPI003791DE60